MDDASREQLRNEIYRIKRSPLLEGVELCDRAMTDANRLYNICNGDTTELLPFLETEDHYLLRVARVAISIGKGKSRCSPS